MFNLLSFFNVSLLNLVGIRTTVYKNQILGCVSLRKSKIGFLNPKESENGFCVSLLNRSIQDLSDPGASKKPNNPLWARIIPSL